MCSDVGNPKKRSDPQDPQKPNYEEMAMMGVDESMCAGCQLYGWVQMLGEWRPLDGYCETKARLGTVRADEAKCDYFVKRGDV